MADSVENWFQREILCHEAALLRFLARRLQNPADVHDVRHDIYVRVLEAAERERPRIARAFLYTVARHILIDRSRREAIVRMDPMEDLDSLNVLIDEVTPERRASDQQALQRLSQLMQDLPARCREVVWMRRVENLPRIHDGPQSSEPIRSRARRSFPDYIPVSDDRNLRLSHAPAM